MKAVEIALNGPHYYEACRDQFPLTRTTLSRRTPFFTRYFSDDVTFSSRPFWSPTIHTCARKYWSAYFEKISLVSSLFRLARTELVVKTMASLVFSPLSDQTVNVSLLFGSTVYSPAGKLF